MLIEPRIQFETFYETPRNRFQDFWLKLFVMEHVSQKKVIVSYLLTSVLIFSASAITSSLGLFGNGLLIGSGTLSTELFILVQLIVVLLSNAIMHGVFYYGGLKSSPITKGVGTGILLGMAYFLICVFGLNMFDINADSLSLIAGAMGGRVFEYSSGGLMTAVISVTDIHKWGLLRAF